MIPSSRVRISNSHESVSIDIPCDRADVWSTAVKKPVGKVKAASQKSVGGLIVSAQVLKCSILKQRSRVHDPNNFNEG